MTQSYDAEPPQPPLYCPCCGYKLRDVGKLSYGNIELNDCDQVRFEGALVSLPRTQHSLVTALVSAKGRGVTRSTLASIVGGDIYDQSVTKYIERTRLAFRSVDPSFDQLESVRGFAAYRWDFRPASN